jgi:CrcB protein
MRQPNGPIDSDVDLRVAADRAELRPSPVPVIAAIAAGGVLGALARHGLSELWPHRPDGFGWSTWTVNLSGCFLIGVLMVLIARRWPDRRLIRPFAGVGVLGGYTTFSTSVVEAQRAAAHSAPGTALLYLAATVIGALAAVWLGTAAAESVVRPR